MASSLSAECTPLKRQYDACFNAWFEGYLGTTAAEQSQEERRERSAQKAKEYEQHCGKIWEDYRRCVQKAVEAKGLTDLLKQARDEGPLVDPPPPHSDSPGKSQ